VAFLLDGPPAQSSTAHSILEEKKMYKTILAPLDGSPRAERILPHVEALAQKFGSRLVLLQVVEPLVAGVSPYDAGSLYLAEEINRRTEEAKQYLAGLQGQLRTQGIEAQTQVEYGPVISTILEVADQHNVDLIAMASHGRTGLARVFYGSVAAGLLNRAERPLLVIRAQE
jgi:nucleotide-binding universal stress UspA family protein